MTFVFKKRKGKRKRLKFQNLIFNHNLSKHVLEILFLFSLFYQGNAPLMSLSLKQYKCTKCTNTRAIVIKTVLCISCFKSKVKTNERNSPHQDTVVLLYWSREKQKCFFSCLRFLVAKSLNGLTLHIQDPVNSGLHFIFYWPLPCEFQNQNKEPVKERNSLNVLF